MTVEPQLCDYRLQQRDYLLRIARAMTARLDLAPDLPTVMADLARLREVFENLPVNAREYSAADTLVRVVARADPGAVRVTVEDQGRGIAPEDPDLPPSRCRGR